MPFRVSLVNVKRDTLKGINHVLYSLYICLIVFYFYQVDLLCVVPLFFAWPKKTVPKRKATNFCIQKYAKNILVVDSSKLFWCNNIKNCNNAMPSLLLIRNCALLIGINSALLCCCVQPCRIYNLSR